MDKIWWFDVNLGQLFLKRLDASWKTKSCTVNWTDEGKKNRVIKKLNWSVNDTCFVNKNMAVQSIFHIMPILFR